MIKPDQTLNWIDHAIFFWNEKGIELQEGVLIEKIIHPEPLQKLQANKNSFCFVC